MAPLASRDRLTIPRGDGGPAWERPGARPARSAWPSSARYA